MVVLLVSVAQLLALDVLLYYLHYKQYLHTEVHYSEDNRCKTIGRAYG